MKGTRGSSTSISRRALLATGLGLAASPALPRLAGAAPAARLFGCAEILLAHSGSVPAWRAVLARHAAQNTGDYASCPAPLRFLASSCGARRWSEMLSAPLPAAGADLLIAVNTRINREPSLPDATLWRTADYWATPREFLALGGDCEDYAAAKFLLLRRAGWPDAALRLTVVQRRRDKELHAVVAVRCDERIYVLDNLYAELRPEGDCSDYEPIYAVSETGLYIYRGEGPG